MMKAEGMSEQPNTRDTQFAGFAILLMKEIDEQVGAVTAWSIEHDIDDQAKIGAELYSRWRTIIARRAYDLVMHTLAAVPHLIVAAGDAKDAGAVIRFVKDLAALPKE